MTWLGALIAERLHQIPCRLVLFVNRGSEFQNAEALITFFNQEKLPASTIVATNVEDGTIDFLRKRLANLVVNFRKNKGNRICQYNNMNRLVLFSRKSRASYILGEYGFYKSGSYREGYYISAVNNLWQCRSKTLAESFSDSNQVREGEIINEIEAMPRNEFYSMALSEMRI